MKTLLTGATGLIGRELVRTLESAVVLSRDPNPRPEGDFLG